VFFVFTRKKLCGLCVLCGSFFLPPRRALRKEIFYNFSGKNQNPYRRRKSFLKGGGRGKGTL
jgi:hypothetical protein